MKKTVLIVDDNSANLYMLKIMLEGEGLEVITAENGKHALDKARQNLPDLIVSDILMPVMDGYALCRQCKADAKLKHIPFVFFTATYTEAKDEKFALDLGADRFILKPQEPQVLIKTLIDLLEETHAVKPSAAKPLGAEMEFFRRYNEILFSKLENKMADLETANQRLIVLEERYRLTFENVTDVIYMVDTDLNIVSISPSVERVLGYKPEDFIGRPVSDLQNILTPESFKQAVTNTIQVLKGGTIPAPVYQFIAKDGTIKYGEVNGSPIMREGRIVGITAVARDITERKRAEEALLETQDLLNEVGRIATIGGWRMDLITRKATWTQGTYDIVEIEPGQPAPGPDEHVDYYLPEYRPLVVEAMRALIEDDKPLDFEVPLRTAKGNVKWCRAKGKAVRKDGNPVEVYGTFQDITERKRMEEELRDSEERYRRIVEASTDAVLFRCKDIIIYANPAALKLFRASHPEELIGKQYLDLVHPDDRAISAERVKKSMDENQPTSPREHRILALDGQAVYVESTGVPIKYRGETHVFGIFRDITDRKQAAVALESERTLLRNLIDNMPDRIYAKDSEGRFIICNEAMMRRMGKTSMAEIVGKSDFDLLPPEIARRFHADEQAIIQTGIPMINREEPLATEGGKITRWNLASKVPLLDRQGNRIGVVGVGREITDRKQAEQKANMLASLVRHSREMINLTTPDGMMLFLNDAGKEMLGICDKDVAKTNIMKVIPDDLRDKVQKEVMPTVVEHGRWEGDLQYRNLKTGALTDVRAVIFKIADSETGASQYLANISMDITARKRDEEALRKSEERYREFFATSRDCVFITSKEGKWINFNDAAVEIFGYDSREELSQVSIASLYANPEERTAFTALIEEQGYVKEYPVPLKRKDGVVIDALITVGFRRGTDDSKIEYYGTIRDITKRKKTENEREKILLWQQGVNQLQQSLFAPAALEKKLKAITDSIVHLFDADFCRIWLIRPGDLCEQGCVHADVQEGPHICRYRGQCLHLLASSGRYTHTDGNIHRRVPFGCYRIGRIASGEDHKFLANDVQNDPRVHNHEWARELGLLSFVGYQLRVSDGTTMGVLALFAKHPISPPEDTVLEGLSSAVAAVIQRDIAEESLHETLGSLRKAVQTTIQVMVSAVETRDPYTAGHQTRCADLAWYIATEMGLSQERIDGIRMTGIVHDIGKLSVPAEILSKPTKLSKIEFSLIKEHSLKGYEMLKDVESPWPLAQIVYQHHERLDGSGYPRNLKGDDILIEARILAVADVVEAMSSHRPYRPSLGIPAALEEIEKNRGTLYDEAVVDACLRLFREKGFKFQVT